jgi:hypothetical protein
MCPFSRPGRNNTKIHCPSRLIDGLIGSSNRSLTCPPRRGPLFCQAKRLLNAWLMDILFTIFRICGSQQIAPAREEGLVRESSDPWAGLRSTRRRRRAGNCGACLSHGVETREQSSGARIEAKQRDQSLLRSPAGYWEAQPTATWCGQPGSNRHSAYAPRDFKSLASTNSAMPAALIFHSFLP